MFVLRHLFSFVAIFTISACATRNLPGIDKPIALVHPVDEQTKIYSAVIQRLIQDSFNGKPASLIINPAINDIPNLDAFLSRKGIRVFDKKAGVLYAKRSRIKGGPFTIHIEIQKLTANYALVFAGFPHSGLSGNTDKYYLKKEHGKWTVYRHEEYLISKHKNGPAKKGVADPRNEPSDSTQC